jgi:O-antigen ligase
LLFQLLSGSAGKIRYIDIFLLLFSFWIILTLVFHHGFSRLPYTMVTIIELLGGYLIGRTLIRSFEDVVAFLRFGLLILALLAPFVIIELITDRNILQEISRKFFPTLVKLESSRGRIGMFRVMAGFEHPILYGLFCSTFFAPLVYIFYRSGVIISLLIGVFIIFMAFASLSSAPLIATVLQFLLMLWGLITKRRWWLLLGLFLVAYVIVDVLSNRTPVTILINYITFDPATAWGRIAIWDYGSTAMWGSPIFGIGLNEWPRPTWLTSSVDNFWLLTGMRHGVVGVLLLIIGLICGLWIVMRATQLPKQVAAYREAYIIMVVGLCFSLTTVHVWGDTSAFIMLLFGSAVWIADTRPDSVTGPLPVPQGRGGLTFSRFERKLGRQRA